MEYPQLLLALAEEYLTVSYDAKTQGALARGDARMEDYYHQVSTALRCMEVVLTRYRLPPVREAHLRLRYAKILIAETENDLEAETALSKGIDLCGRNRFWDLKYDMQLQLYRVLYRSNPKAAVKSMDIMIEELAAYKHTAWEYAFRILRARLAVANPSFKDFNAAFHHLQKTEDLARQHGDSAVFMFAATLEALIHLQSPASDSVEQSQNALALARRLQLDTNVETIPQIQVMIQYIDLCSALQQAQYENILQKLSATQETMDAIANNQNWRYDGTFFLPLSAKSVQGTPLMGSDTLQQQDSQPVLVVNWLPKTDIYSIGFLLSGISSRSKNAQGEHEAESFLNESGRLVRGDSASSNQLSEPWTTSTELLQWRKTLECQLLLERALLLCARSEWALAGSTLDEASKICRDFQNELLHVDFHYLMAYIRGVILQGMGHLSEALAIFLGEDLAFPAGCSKTSRLNVRRDLALLAALNSILIIRSPSHASHYLLPSILSITDPYLAASPNKHLVASYSLVLATLDPSTHHLISSPGGMSTTLQSTSPSTNTMNITPNPNAALTPPTTANPTGRPLPPPSSSLPTTSSSSSSPSTTTHQPSSALLTTKKHLSIALQLSKTINNIQITAITLSVMCAKFFAGVLGVQAEKSARAGVNMSHKSGMKLWMAVSQGMLADTLERHRHVEESARARRVAGVLMDGLPPAVRERVGGSGTTIGGEKGGGSNTGSNTGSSGGGGGGGGGREGERKIREQACE